MGLIEAVKAKGRGVILGMILKKAAKGDFGPQVKWLYWNCREVKTDIGLALGGVLVAIWFADYIGVCSLAMSYWDWFNCALWTSKVEWVTGSLSAAFIALGQADGSLHLEGPTLEDEVGAIKSSYIDGRGPRKR